jgi:ribosomal protein L5
MVVEVKRKRRMERYKAAEKVVKIKRGWKGKETASNGAVKVGIKEDEDLDEIVNDVIIPTAVPSKRPSEAVEEGEIRSEKLGQ